jgi:hypothetical protein
LEYGEQLLPQDVSDDVYNSYEDDNFSDDEDTDWQPY